jgi:hypothetical protein
VEHFGFLALLNFFSDHKNLLLVTLPGPCIQGPYLSGDQGQVIKKEKQATIWDSSKLQTFLLLQRQQEYESSQNQIKFLP